MKKIFIFAFMALFLIISIQAEAKEVNTKKEIYTEIAKNFAKQKHNFSIDCPKNNVVKSLVKRINSTSNKKYYAALYEITSTTDKASTINDGDYLYANLYEVYCKYSNGQLKFYDIVYFETKAQTKKVDKKLKPVIKNIKKQSSSKIGRIRLAYEYVIEQVKYDSRKNCNSSAYDGLFKKKTVCNGYAMILYRMLNKMNIPCKFVSGSIKDNGKKYLHAWNMAKWNGKWYNLDSCWDDSEDGEGTKDYFMKTDKSNTYHIKDSFFKTKAFKNKYPMSSKNYVSDSSNGGTSEDNTNDDSDDNSSSEDEYWDDEEYDYDDDSDYDFDMGFDY